MIFEAIDAIELAKRWNVPASWVRNHSRGSKDCIPHVKLGKYVRFEWGSPALLEWWAKRRS